MQEELSARGLSHYYIGTVEATPTLEDVLSAADQTKLIRPVDSLFSHLPALTLGTKETIRCKNGGEIPNQAGDDGEYRVYGPDGEFLMLGRLSGGTLKNVKSFFEVS